MLTGHDLLLYIGIPMAVSLALLVIGRRSCGRHVDVLSRWLPGLALAAGTATILFLTPAEVTRRFGDAPPSDPAGADRMVALTLRTRALADAKSLLAAAGVAHDAAADRIVVPAREAFGVALAFVA